MSIIISLIIYDDVSDKIVVLIMSILKKLKHRE